MSNVVQLLSWRFGHYSMIEWGMMLVWFFAYGLTAALLMGLDNQNVTIVNYMIEIVFFYGLFIWIGNFGHLSTQLFHGNPFPYVRRLPIPESALLMARMVLSAGFVFIAAFFSIIIFVLLGDVHVNILSLLVFWLGISFLRRHLYLQSSGRSVQMNS
ncbi:hypothetical protein JCM19037_3846 [Geomicrobium sp. JCM 19037]|uniref:hypothetical protein n=1 Tax=Geomicrobium sp. JCM 19037 TaxID=1460634 RepID=UPI00045F114B|nr:hypothetical protein [Geomicrobium sp. JCM 19037]GAK05356.1 hypothetical protein JCM19037_3846 [Geomicrobium sp. JCM 19037]